MTSYEYPPTDTPLPPDPLKPKEDAFKTAIQGGIDYALKLIEHNFDNPDYYRERLYFHTSEHTKEVIDRTEQILKIVFPEAEKNPEEMQLVELGKLAAAFHDVNQDWKEDVSEPPKVVRKRYTGKIEEFSVTEAHVYMDDLTKHPPVFNNADKEVVKRAIMLTVPTFDGPVVYQQGFKEEYKDKEGVVAQAVALADIGGCGIDGGKVSVRDALGLFLEINLDVVDYIHKGEINFQTEELFRQRFIEFLTAQRVFIAGRKARIVEEIKSMNISDPAKSKLEFEFFNPKKFDEASNTVQAFIDRLNTDSNLQQFQNWVDLTNVQEVVEKEIIPTLSRDGET